MNELRPYDAAFHDTNSIAAGGRCSQHGVDSCDATPVISFVDVHNRRQSGCSRAARELLDRGEIPAAPWLDALL